MIEGPIRVAVDIGGTFTDLQVLEENSGRHYAFKTPSTPHDPSEGLIEGLTGASTEYGFELTQIGVLMHGTTIATNAVLENKLPRGALVTTAGFRDVLEIGRHLRRDVYASRAESRRLLITRADRHGVPERIAADGRVDRPLDESAAYGVARRVAASGAAAVAVCLINAYANPAHEQRLGEILREVLGHDHVSLSHELSPEPREFERTSTTALNALLMPVVKGYLDRLEARLATLGIAPRVYLVQSNAGVTTPQAAGRQPARLLLSGPSGGALAAEVLGRVNGEPELVAVDMGGTSFDVSVVHQGVSRIVNQGDVDGAPVRLPMVEIRTIGAGGGSIARAGAGGRLLVGPESAGAAPGPVAYGQGGTAPTVTDANVALGRIDPDYFLGGRMHLDADAARAAIHAEVAAPLALDDTEAAAGVVRIAVAHMASAIRLSLFEQGLDPKDFALLAFGGAGGLHAAEVADALGARRVLYPRDGGTLSAYGMLHCDVVHDAARSRLLPADAGSAPAMAALAAELLAEGEARLAADGIDESAREYRLRADLRYPGQAYEITTALPALVIDAPGLARAVAEFHDLHEARYAHADRHVTPELVTLRLAAVGRLRRPAERPPSPAGSGEPAGMREIVIGEAARDVPVYRREALGGHDAIAGPVVVEDPYATIVVPDGWTIGTAPSGDLVARRQEMTT